ncbi:MAG: hypothetical protein AAF515_10065 [Pseudomonadota bacterium]
MLNGADTLSSADIDRLRAEFSPEELTELALGVAAFHGMSKVLIVLGMEPESMAVTQLPTPGAPS